MKVTVATKGAEYPLVQASAGFALRVNVPHIGEWSFKSLLLGAGV